MIININILNIPLYCFILKINCISRHFVIFICLMFCKLNLYFVVDFYIGLYHSRTTIVINPIQSKLKSYIIYDIIKIFIIIGNTSSFKFVELDLSKSNNFVIKIGSEYMGRGVKTLLCYFLGKCLVGLLPPPHNYKKKLLSSCATIAQ